MVVPDRAAVDFGEAIQRSYDAVPYGSHAFAFTHPSRLAAVARLCGLDTPAISQCRVLELGSASGGNLMPMAVQLPQAKFLGIDVSTVQIEDGLRTIRELRLTNVDLRAMDILDITPALGEFDYIIAHGVYSWVPPKVREKILGVFRENLAPNGVAFVSFDIYPGRFMQLIVRELMLVHAADRGAENWKDRLAAGREMLGLLQQMLHGQQTPFATMLRQEAESLGALDDNILIHSALGEINAPVFFHEFLDDAAAAELKYVGEAIPATTAMDQFPPQIRQIIEGASKSDAAAEQMIDVLRKRALRKSILCHAGVGIDRKMNADRMLGLFVASPAKATGGGNYTLPHGDSFGIDDPLVQSLLARLMQAWPQSVAVEQLISAADPAQSQPLVCAMLLQLLRLGLIEADAHPPACTKEFHGKALASALARMQAMRYGAVTHLRHDQVTLPPLHRQLIQKLDGLHNPAELASEMNLDAPQVGQALSDLAQNALLMSS